ncbi:GDSL-type esterase/lipase family protein [Rhodohalobacter sp. 8-1]|uniref:GDSL-type esterase/lipase family protein n=1 Tax=Rhodohalobacter sp. 8-1 TaxID=3131972 RepID=UPI0030EF9D99
MLYSRILLLQIAFVCTMCSGLMAQANMTEPDPLRFEEEIDSFAGWDAKNSAPDDALLFVGSSSIRFWDTAKAFPDYPVINRGFGGSHLSDVLYYYDRVIGRFDPSMILLYCGENDIAAGLDPDKVFDDYTELLSRIGQPFPDADVVYISIKPSGSRQAFTDQFEAFNERVKKFNETTNRLHYVDLASLLIHDNGTPDDSLFVDDRLHLNENGYRLWNEKMREFLADIR